MKIKTIVVAPLRVTLLYIFVRINPKSNNFNLWICRFYEALDIGVAKITLLEPTYLCGYLQNTKNVKNKKLKDG